MYQVHGHLRTRTFRVLWALEELGQTYDHIPAKPQSEEIRAVSPAGKVPALSDGGTVITDSAAILTYLADKHGALTHPAGTLDRARQDSITHALLDELEAPLWTYAKHSFVFPEDRRVPEIKDSLKWEFSRGLKALDQRLRDSEYLAGDTLTVPDIIATHLCNWGGKAGMDVSGDAIAPYLDRTRGREAYKRTDALDA